eukprot:TRINITY_DN8831_c0_g1_i4.p1 TRINITY_DN8831_c0_g1~~TRINITY_DN8831_c0_g1_i4.p1  ORF type:complete len:625 (+),score=69.70 TRINITY_DN8831_c0_g1_i4:384-2258(+)
MAFLCGINDEESFLRGAPKEIISMIFINYGSQSGILEKMIHFLTHEKPKNLSAPSDLCYEYDRTSGSSLSRLALAGSLYYFFPTLRSCAASWLSQFTKLSDECNYDLVTHLFVCSELYTVGSLESGAKTPCELAKRHSHYNNHVFLPPPKEWWPLLVPLIKSMLIREIFISQLATLSGAIYVISQSDKELQLSLLCVLSGYSKHSKIFFARDFLDFICNHADPLLHKNMLDTLQVVCFIQDASARPSPAIMEPVFALIHSQTENIISYPQILIDDLNAEVREKMLLMKNLSQFITHCLGVLTKNSPLFEYVDERALEAIVFLNHCGYLAPETFNYDADLTETAGDLIWHCMSGTFMDERPRSAILEMGLKLLDRERFDRISVLFYLLRNHRDGFKTESDTEFLQFVWEYLPLAHKKVNLHVLAMFGVNLLSIPATKYTAYIFSDLLKTAVTPAKYTLYNELLVDDFDSILPKVIEERLPELARFSTWFIRRVFLFPNERKHIYQGKFYIALQLSFLCEEDVPNEFLELFSHITEIRLPRKHMDDNDYTSSYKFLGAKLFGNCIPEDAESSLPSGSGMTDLSEKTIKGCWRLMTKIEPFVRSKERHRVPIFSQMWKNRKQQKQQQ